MCRCERCNGRGMREEKREKTKKRVRDEKRRPKDVDVEVEVEVEVEVASCWSAWSWKAGTTQNPRVPKEASPLSASSWWGLEASAEA